MSTINWWDIAAKFRKSEMHLERPTRPRGQEADEAAQLTMKRRLAKENGCDERPTRQRGR